MFAGFFFVVFILFVCGFTITVQERVEALNEKLDLVLNGGEKIPDGEASTDGGPAKPGYGKKPCMSPLELKFLIDHYNYHSNLLHLNFSMFFLHTVLYTFPMLLTRRICLTSKTNFSCFFHSHNLNPFSPMSDKDRISPHFINTSSSRHVKGIK